MANEQEKQGERPVQAQASERTDKQVARFTARSPVGKRLPGAVLEELQREVESEEALTPGRVEAIDEKLHIEERHGVSRRKLRNFMQRWRDVKDNVKSGKQHERQESIGEILKQLFGTMTECAPNMWEHRTFLMLIGIVYTKLAVNEEEISTEELTALGKLLAEQRRANASSAAKTAKSASSSTAPERGGEPEKDLAEAVREVYGVTLPVES